jgi:hypothetical protein
MMQERHRALEQIDPVLHRLTDIRRGFMAPKGEEAWLEDENPVICFLSDHFTRTVP